MEGGVWVGFGQLCGFKQGVGPWRIRDLVGL